MKYIIAILIGLSCVVEAKHLHTEKWYQEQTCKGEMEYRLPDGKRIDCLTDTHAIEYDFAKKWAECVGQALYYSSQTGENPGCKLIIESPKDCKYIKPLLEINQAFNTQITVWTVGKVCK